MEKRYVRKDGGIVWAHLSVALVRDADGAPDYFISIVTDITARRRAEADLLASRRELEQAVEALKEGDRRKDEFLATLAHELRKSRATSSPCGASAMVSPCSCAATDLR